MKINFNLFCFSIFFAKEKVLLKNISSFFFDKNKKLDKTLTYSKVKLNQHWIDTVYGVLPKFFIGSCEDEPYSVFFSNASDGWSTAATCLSKYSGCRSIQIRMSNAHKHPVFTYKIVENGEITRVIQLLKENRWVFYEQGTPLPYENIELYKSKVKKNRLNNDLILEYLKAEGVDFESVCNNERIGFVFKTNSYPQDERRL